MAKVLLLIVGLLTLASVPSQAAPPALWVLTVGVSDYGNPDLNLRFADADATAIAEELSRQARGSLYRQVKTLTLTNAQVSRESVFRAMRTFLEQAQFNDVVVLFLAGHGVQDRATRSYYFLPHGASVDDVLTGGIRMSDFDELVRALRRNVGRVVLMLDTCHSGASRLPGAGVSGADDLAVRLSAGGGLYLLAASNPGELSVEKPELGHGVLTQALLEGLSGAADPDHDRLIPVSDLFSYVGRRVPELTDGAQHPYNKTEGSALTLAAVVGGGAPRAIPAAVPTEAPPRASGDPSPNAAPRNAIAVLDFENLRGNPDHQWIGRALRAALNTELSKVRELNVYSPELLDFTSRNAGAGVLQTASRLGVEKMVTGSFTVVGDEIRIDVNIVEAPAGTNIPGGSDHVLGQLGKFFDLQSDLTTAVLKRLQVDVAGSDTGVAVQKNVKVDALRLLLNAEQGGAPPAIREPSTTTPEPRREPHSQLPFDLLAWLVPAAQAQAPPDDASTEARAAIDELLERYRLALERKDLDALAALYDVFTAEHRSAMREYLDAVDALKINFEDVRVSRVDGNTMVSFLRKDHFKDRSSSELVDLEIRVTKFVIERPDGWRIVQLPAEGR